MFLRCSWTGAGAQPLSQRNIGFRSNSGGVWRSLRRRQLQAWRRQKNWLWSWGLGPAKGAEDAALLAHLKMEETQACARPACEGCLVVGGGHGPQAEVAQGVGPGPLVEH